MTLGEYRIVAVVLWSLVFLTQQQLARGQEECALALNVVNSATHTGLPHAMVSYAGPESGYRFTDTSGNVRVENVSCGSYALSVSKPGFVASAQTVWRDVLLNPARLDEFNAELAEQAERKFSTTQTAVHLTRASGLIRVALLPVSSIAGVVVNENGEPLEGISVQAITAQASLAGVNYILARTTRTDNSGHYSLAGLVPGDYVVRLAGKFFSEDPATEAVANGTEGRRGIPLVYYSGVNTLAEATILHMTPGQHASADFQHAMQPAVDIDGQLTGFVPGASTKIEFYPENDRIPAGNVFVNTVTGRFHVLGVPAGTYTLRVLQYPTTPSQWLTAEVPLVVKSKPFHDLIIPLSRGVTLPISVSYEAGAETDEPVEVILQPQHTRIKRQLVVGDSSRPLSEGKIQPPFQRFLLANMVPDSYKLYVTLSDRSKNYVAAATLGKADVLHSEFRLAGNPEDELHVTIRGDSASVAGQVVLQEQLAAGAQIYLIPAESPAWTRMGTADQHGQFRIQGIPPGHFRVRAWMGTPSLADLLSGSGELLVLQPGENKTAMLEAVQTNLEQGER